MRSRYLSRSSSCSSARSSLLRQASTPAVVQSSAPSRSPCSVSNSATRSQVRASDLPSDSFSSRSRASASALRPSANIARASGTRGSSNVGPASAIAVRNSSTAASGSSASSHCSPARICASAREMPTGVACAARRLIRTAALLWLPVRAAFTSMASNSSPDSATTLANLPTVAVDNPDVFSFLPAGTLKRIPEAPPQRVSYLVVQEEVDRQRRTLQQPGLEVRRHPRLPRQHRLQPQRRRVPGHRVAELLAFFVRGLHRLGERDPAGLRRVAGGTRGRDRLRPAVRSTAGLGWRAVVLTRWRA